MIDYTEEDIENVILDDHYLVVFNSIDKLKKNKPFYEKSKHHLKFYYYRDHHKSWFNSVWDILEYLSKKTIEEGHCPQKDLCKMEIQKLLGI